MNYIQKLQARVAELEAAQAAQDERIQELRRYLTLPKFTQPATDGSRTDWISTADVDRWIRYIAYGDHC